MLTSSIRITIGRGLCGVGPFGMSKTAGHYPVIMLREWMRLTMEVESSYENFLSRYLLSLD